eukprot:TRINITY_DN9081_c0_g1_i2.p1 TRINITY_DN9081_c0_g1~~TRINITY_DN9081_c0_g1_i2.p1  ORF type:complete len:160 (-),score=26.88 TRINITY_DN9081_c0_g1_i2:39-518(-)
MCIRDRVKVDTFTIDLASEEAGTMIQERLEKGGTEPGDPVDIVVSCLDNRDARLVVHQVRQALGKPWLDASMFTDGMTGCVQYMSPGVNCLEFRSDRAVEQGVVMGSLPSTTSMVAGMLVQTVMKLHLGFGVVPRFTGLNAIDNSCSTEPPADSMELLC